MEDKHFLRNRQNGIEPGSEIPYSKIKEPNADDLDIDEVWDNLSMQLDIDEVWEGISNELDKDKRKHRFATTLSWSAAAAIIILAGYFVLIQDTIINNRLPYHQNVHQHPNKNSKDTSLRLPSNKNHHHATKMAGHPKEQAITHPLLIIVNPAVRPPQPIQGDTITKTGRPRMAFCIPTHELQVTKNTGNEKNVVNLDQAPVDQIEGSEESKKLVQDNYHPLAIVLPNKLDVNFNSTKPGIDQLALPKLEFHLSNPISADSVSTPPGKQLLDVQSTDISSQHIISSTVEPSAKNKHHSNISIGVSSVMKDTWLINKETKDGLDKNNMNTTRVELYTDFGINVLYAISRRWSLEGVGYYSSTVGQSYYQYINGDYSKKEITLKYTSFELAAKFSNYDTRLYPNFRMYTIIGPYFSKLHSAKQDINGSTLNLTSNYLNIDYGIVLGQEAEFRLFNRFAIAPGIRIKLGIPNIYTGESGLASSLKRTHSGSIDFRLALYYNL